MLPSVPRGTPAVAAAGLGSGPPPDFIFTKGLGVGILFTREASQAAHSESFHAEGLDTNIT